MIFGLKLEALATSSYPEEEVDARKEKEGKTIN